MLHSTPALTRATCPPQSQRTMSRRTFCYIPRTRPPHLLLSTTYHTRGSWGPLRRPRAPHSFPALPRVLPPQIPAGHRCFHFFPASPHGGPLSPPRQLSWRVISGRRSRQPVYPLVAFLPRFLALPMATPSACRIPTPALTRASCPPPSPRPMCRRSFRSIPRSCPPLLFLSSTPLAGLCGRSPLPLRSCPWP